MSIVGYILIIMVSHKILVFMTASFRKGAQLRKDPNKWRKICNVSEKNQLNFSSNSLPKV